MVAGLASAGVDVAAARCHSHPGRGLPDRGPGRRLRRGHLREPQPGPGQRDQVLRPRRRQAAGRDGGPDRGSAGGRPSRGPNHVRPGHDAGAEQERYLDHLLSTLPDRSLAGLRVVADCAHGAAYRIAPEALRRAGADVLTIGVEPDGLNINAGCGSTALGALVAAVIEHGADAGIAYDGDADRCLAVDADGQPLDGDQILTVLATELKEAGRLTGDAVVVTVMSNQGFYVAMRDAGMKVIETPVGDKHVSAAMRDGGYVLGGDSPGTSSWVNTPPRATAC